MDEAVRKACIALREKNFRVTAHKARFGDYENECSLEITHNGFQYGWVSLSESEAKKVIAELSKFFGFEKSQ